MKKVRVNRPGKCFSALAQAFLNFVMREAETLFAPPVRN